MRCVDGANPCDMRARQSFSKLEMLMFPKDEEGYSTAQM